MIDSTPAVPPTENRLLASLPKDELERLIPQLRPIALRQGDILHEQNESPQKVYFLTHGIAVLTVSTTDGRDLELSMVGNEGVVGERAVFEGGLPLIRCSMLTDGSGYYAPPVFFKEEFDKNHKLHDTVMRSIEARLAETSQVALCGHMHSVEHRLCRWLLALADRLHSEELPVTHELMGRMLGVRRAGVTEVAGVLRNAGIIDYARGNVVILNRAELEKRSCECYRVIMKAIKNAYDFNPQRE